MPPFLQWSANRKRLSHHDQGCHASDILQHAKNIKQTQDDEGHAGKVKESCTVEVLPASTQQENHGLPPTLVSDTRDTI